MPEKNILIYSYSFYPYDNAISNAMLPVFKALQKDYNVYIYTINQSKSQKCPSHELYNNFNIYRDTDEKYLKACKKMKHLRNLYEISQYDENAKGTNVLASIAKRPIILFLRKNSEKILLKLNHIENTVITPFETLLKSKNFCAVLSVLTPFCVSKEIMKFARNGYLKSNNIKWISYFVDPYSTFIEHLQSDSYEKMYEQELEVYKYSDLVITTPELCQDNKKYKMAEYCDKTIPVQLATFKKINASFKKSSFSKEFVNCVFCGSLFSVIIRNPQYFYNVISNLPDNFKIHIVCYQSCVEADALKEKFLSGKKNIVWYNRLPIQKCFDMLMNADILINLGNECDNQTPSKVFDYLGCAKPIINFYSIDNDTSKKYLDRYPYKLNIKNKDSLDENDVNLFVEFCNKNKDTKITFEKVENLYYEFNADRIGQNVTEIINNICKEVKIDE